MGDGSPLFHSALDLLAHAAEHYVANTDRDRKLVVLHLANAVELLLKDRLLDLQISIYENPKQTKSVTKVLSDLQKNKIDVPRKHIIELLIDERNNLQHRFGSPDAISTKYYFDNSLRFFEEFMNAAFGLELRQYLANMLDPNTLAFIYPASEASKDVLAQARAVAKIHPSSSILTAWMEIEKKVNELRAMVQKESKQDQPWFRYPAGPFLRNFLRAFVPASGSRERLMGQIVRLSITRNMIVHAATDASAEAAQHYIVDVEEIIPQIEEFKSQFSEQMKHETKPDRKRKRAVSSIPEG